MKNKILENMQKEEIYKKIDLSEQDIYKVNEKLEKIGNFSIKKRNFFDLSESQRVISIIIYLFLD